MRRAPGSLAREAPNLKFKSQGGVVFELQGNCKEARAVSSEVDTGSRKETASKQEAGASVLIKSEPNMRLGVAITS
jgi:hypothetical protein